jgi:iron complex outermembrane receptor protein
MNRQNKLRLRLLLGSAIMAAALPAFAQAQTAAPVAPEEQATGLDDIIVTATRRETNLQDTPIAVSVVNAEALKNRHVQSLYDLADGAVPRCASPPSKPASRP